MFSRRTEADHQPEMCVQQYIHTSQEALSRHKQPQNPLWTAASQGSILRDQGQYHVAAQLLSSMHGHARSPRVEHLCEFIRCHQEGSHRDDSFSHVSPHRHMPHLVHLLSNFIAFSSETGIFMINNGVKGRRQDSSCSVLTFLDSNTYIVGPIDLLNNYWVDISGHTA